ncbi:MAG: hypothetical protein BWY19_00458 [bacterium ADurb.Bin212]|jgi:hypothetical protein|nr:MAG: hypothetical protein BWY19_00458 [bacterium ADurb.Bin212]
MILKSIIRYLNRDNVNIVVVALAYALVSYLNWTPMASIFFVLFIWFLLNPIKTSDALKISIITLAVSPLLLMVKRRTNAEYLAQISFFFLVIALITEIRFRKSRVE